VTQAQPLQHDGTPIPPEDYFAVSPDDAIGRISNAQSNKTRSGFKSRVGNEWSVLIALAVIAFLCGGGLGIGITTEVINGFFARGIWQPMEYRTTLSIIGGLGGAIVPTVIVVFLATMLRKERMSWVGEAGLMRWEKGLFGSKSETFRYADGVSLTSQRTRHYVNGAYSGTRYNYTWWGPNGKKAFVIEGQYSEAGAGLVKGKATPAHDPAMFAFAAERGWSRYRIAQVDREIAARGVAAFGTSTGIIRIGREFVEFEQAGKVERLDRSQIQSATVLQGFLTIKRVGAKEGWFSSDGVFKFPVSGMADFAVFAAIFEEQLKLRLTSP
jgi:hypothetical protein